jgi:hypothetical protein
MSDWVELEEFYGDTLTGDQRRALNRTADPNPLLDAEVT